MALEKLAIIGGGIGGLASAILFSEKGYQVTMYDKAPSPLPVGAGFLLQPPGQAVLSKLNVLDTITQHAIPIHGLHSQTTSGRNILDLKYARLKGLPRNGLGVQRTTIYQALLDKAKANGQVDFVWGNNVAKCINKGSTVSVIANDTSQDYDLCILSSGANSLLANEHFANRIKRPYGWGCVWTTFELPATLSPHILHQRCQSANKMMGILPVNKINNKYEAALYWSMNSRDIKRFDEDTFPGVKDEIMQFWPEAQTSLEPLGFNNFICANYNDIWTPKPFTGRIIALGDVSHATSPQLGQGCTMALLDAWRLASCVTKCDKELDASLTQWWKSRKYQLAYVRHLSKLLTPLFQSESKICEVFRDWIMSPVGRLPVFDKIQLKTLASEILLNAKDLHELSQSDKNI